MHRQGALLDVPSKPRRAAPRLGLSSQHQSHRPQYHRHVQHANGGYVAESPGYDDAWLVQRALAGIDDLSGTYAVGAPGHVAANGTDSTANGRWQVADANGTQPRNTSMVEAQVPLSMDDIQEAIAQVDTQHSAVRTQAMDLLQRREYASAMQLMAQLDHLQYSATRLRSTFHDKKMMRLHDAVLRQHIQEFRVDKIDELREAIASAMDCYLAHEGGIAQSAALGNAASATGQNSTLEIAFSRLQQYEATLGRFHRLLSHRMTQVLTTAVAAPVQARLHAEHLLTTVRAAATQGLSEVQVFNCLDCRTTSIPDELRRRMLQVLSRPRNVRAMHSSLGASPAHSAGDGIQRPGRLARHRGQFPRDQHTMFDTNVSGIGQSHNNQANDDEIDFGDDTKIFAPPGSNTLNLAAVMKGRAGRREQRQRLRSALAFMRQLCEVSECDLPRRMGIRDPVQSASSLSLQQHHFSVSTIDGGFIVCVPPGASCEAVFEIERATPPAPYFTVTLRDSHWLRHSPHAGANFVLAALCVHDVEGFFYGHESHVPRATLKLVHAQLGKWVDPAHVFHKGNSRVELGHGRVPAGSRTLNNDALPFLRVLLLLNSETWSKIVGFQASPPNVAPRNLPRSNAWKIESQSLLGSTVQSNEAGDATLADVSPKNRRQARQAVHMAMGALAAAGVNKATPLAVRKIVSRSPCFPCMTTSQWNRFIRACIDEAGPMLGSVVPSPEGGETATSLVVSVVDNHGATQQQTSEDQPPAPKVVPPISENAVDKRKSSGDATHSPTFSPATRSEGGSLQSSITSPSTVVPIHIDSQDAEATGDVSLEDEVTTDPLAETRESASASPNSLQQSGAGSGSRTPTDEPMVLPGLVTGLRLSITERAPQHAALDRALSVAQAETEDIDLDDIDVAALESRLRAVKKELQDAHELNFVDEIEDLTWERDKLVEQIQVARENGFVASPQSTSVSMVDLIQAAAAEKALEDKREAYRERRRVTKHKREESKETFPTMVERRGPMPQGSASRDRPTENDDAVVPETKQSAPMLPKAPESPRDHTAGPVVSVGDGAGDTFGKSSTQISRAHAASRGSPRRRKSTVGAGTNLARQQRKHILDKLRDNPVVMEKLRSNGPDNSADTPVLPAGTSNVDDDNAIKDDGVISGFSAESKTPSKFAAVDDDGQNEASLEISLAETEPQETTKAAKEDSEDSRTRVSASARQPTPVTLEEAMSSPLQQAKPARRSSSLLSDESFPDDLGIPAFPSSPRDSDVEDEDGDKNGNNGSGRSHARQQIDQSSPRRRSPTDLAHRVGRVRSMHSLSPEPLAADVEGANDATLNDGIPELHPHVTFMPAPSVHDYKRGSLFSSKCKTCGEASAKACAAKQETALMMVKVENESRAKACIKDAIPKLKRRSNHRAFLALLSSCSAWLSDKHPSMIIARKAFNDTQAYSPSGSRSVSASPTGEAAGSSRRQRAASRSLSRPKSESYSATRKRGGSSPSSSPILAGASVADDSTVEQETAPPLSIGQSLTSRKRVDTPAYPQSPGVPSLRKNPAVEENAHQQSPSRSPSPSGGPSAASDGGRKSRASSFAEMDPDAAAAIAETRRRMSMRSMRRQRRPTARSGDIAAASETSVMEKENKLRRQLKNAGINSTPFGHAIKPAESLQSGEIDGVADAVLGTASEYPQNTATNADVAAAAIAAETTKNEDSNAGNALDMGNDDAARAAAADRRLAEKEAAERARRSEQEKAEAALRAEENEARREQNEKEEREAKAEAEQMAARAAAIREKRAAQAAAKAAATATVSAETTTGTTAVQVQVPTPDATQVAVVENPSTSGGAGNVSNDPPAAPSTGAAPDAQTDPAGTDAAAASDPVGAAPAASPVPTADSQTQDLWLTTALTVFPDWDRAGLERFRAAGWTLQGLVDYRRSNDPSWLVPPAADTALIASNGVPSGAETTGSTGSPIISAASPAAAPGAGVSMDLSDPGDLSAWVEKCATVFPDWDKSNLHTFRTAGWTIAALVDHRRSSDPSWQIGSR